MLARSSTDSYVRWQSVATDESPIYGRGQDARQARRSDLVKVTVGGLAVIGVGVALGLTVPAEHSDDPQPWRSLSSCIGWTYFAAWTLSFWPQAGMSLDFQLLNIIGYIAYSAFNVAFYWSPSVQAAYEAHHNGKPNLVRLDDVLFALHGFFATSLTIGQCFIYDRGGQRLSLLAKVTAVLLVLLPCSMATFTYVSGLHDGGPSEFWTWLNVVYLLSGVKIFVTLVKYMPQVYLNWKRQSTVGWNIWNVLLDFTGGMLSLGQLVMDAAVSDNWEGVTGDPAKLGLAFISLFFDTIFIVQHYGLYWRNREDPALRRLASVKPGDGPRPDLSTKEGGGWEGEEHTLINPAR